MAVEMKFVELTVAIVRAGARLWVNHRELKPPFGCTGGSSLCC